MRSVWFVVGLCLFFLACDGETVVDDAGSNLDGDIDDDISEDADVDADDDIDEDADVDKDSDEETDPEEDADIDDESDSDVTDADDDADAADADDDADIADAEVDSEVELGPAVDLLFLVDNSNSMEQEQEALARHMEPFVRELISPTEVGVPAVENIHVGVITADMGTLGHAIPTCSDPDDGDNGELQNTGMLDSCSETYSSDDCTRAECPWLSHSILHPNDGTDDENPPIWEDFECIATLGTGGCGFEQQLESSLVALTDQLEPGGTNEGFLRDDSLLVIVYVTDEDDCSTSNPDMFDRESDLGPLNVRCALHEELLHPISRYYDAFVDLRGGDASQIIVAAVAGIPIDGSWEPGDSIDALRKLRQINPTNPNELLRTCDTTMGAAYPPVRIAELVYEFGDNGILASICREDWSGIFSALTRKIHELLPDGS